MMSKEMDETYFRAYIKIIPTPYLIAELERRRPCERCGRKRFIRCICKWQGIKDAFVRLDNFKERK